MGSSRVTAAPKPHESLLLHLQALLEIVVVALFAATFIVQPFRIPSESMQPTLRVGDFLLGNKQAFAPTGALDKILPPTTLHRVDLVIFLKPNPETPDLILVKRIIGLPGDRLHLRDNHVYLNGKPLTESYAVYAPAPPDSFRDDFPSLLRANPDVNPNWWAQLRRTEVNGEIVVPPNSYFVMGDNRNDSEDSRYWGYVPRSAILARPLLVYFSTAAPPSQPTSATFWHRLTANLHAEASNLRILR